MLFSHFAVSLTTPPFNNLNEFLSKTDQKLLIRANTVEEEVFRDSKDPLKLKIYNDRILPYLNRPEYKLDFCDKLDKIVEDDNYVAFISTNFIRFCKTYRQCQVVSTPFEVSKMFGSG